jgi:ABC-type amino acid transport substrate-binding protein
MRDFEGDHMGKLKLGFVSAFNERVDPLMNGTIQAEGIEIVPTYSHPSETFWRQLRFKEFEVGEMSMSSYLIARERGFDMIALPVFPSRRLFHTELSYHSDSGVKEPGDLAGKRIGVVTGTAMGGLMEHVLQPLTAETGARFEILALENSLYGSSVTTAGLLPGRAIQDALRGRRDLDLALLPAESVNDDLLFMDDLEAHALAAGLPMPVKLSYDFADALVEEGVPA